MIDFRGKEGKQLVLTILKDDASTKMFFYALRTRGDKPGDGNGDDDDYEGKSLYFYFSNMSSF